VSRNLYRIRYPQPVPDKNTLEVSGVGTASGNGSAVIPAEDGGPMKKWHGF
jgi:hypothetical protein